MAASTELTGDPRGLQPGLDVVEGEPTSTANKVYVWEAPVRIWHWVTVLCILTLAVTGYFIGLPPPSVPGEAFFRFLFGKIRMVHFAAGQILAVFFLLRIIWAFIGNVHARQLFTPPLASGKFWREIIEDARWYLFIDNYPKKYVGHNPMAALAMFFMCVLPLITSILTGFALYSEGQGIDSWWYSTFGWVFGVLGDSFFVHTVHRISMWVIVWFSMIHIYLTVRQDIMSRQSIISTMVSGWRYFKDTKE